MDVNTVTAVDQVWATDITYMPLQKRFLWKEWAYAMASTNSKERNRWLQGYLSIYNRLRSTQAWAGVHISSGSLNCSVEEPGETQHLGVCPTEQGGGAGIVGSGERHARRQIPREASFIAKSRKNMMAFLHFLPQYREKS